MGVSSAEEGRLCRSEIKVEKFAKKGRKDKELDKNSSNGIR